MKDPIVLTSHAALREMIREELETALAKAIPRETPSEILSCDQVAELLGIHRRTIQTLIHNEGLPHLGRIGKLWRFRRSDVIAWLSKRKRTA